MPQRTFYVVKFATMAKPVAINASEIRAVSPTGSGDSSFDIWLVHPLTLSVEQGNRIAKLGGTVPHTSDQWTVYSSDLKELFPS